MPTKLLIDQLNDLSKKFHLHTGFEYYSDFYFKRHEDIGSILKLWEPQFPSVQKSFTERLTYAANLYYYSVLGVDKMIDCRKTTIPVESLMMSFVLREESLSIIYSLFNPGDIFWNYFNKYYAEYVQAISLESHLRTNNKHQITTEVIEKIYSGKSALAKASIVALAIKEKNIDIISSMEKSVDFFQIAYGFVDDVNDWKHDWENGQFSYLLKNTFFRNKYLKNTVKDAKIIGKYVFFSGEATHMLSLAIEYYHNAIFAIQEYNCKEWIGFVSKNISICKDLKHDIETIVNKELVKVGAISPSNTKLKRPNIQLNINSINPIIAHSVTYIVKQWQQNFQDTVVYSYFPARDQFIFKNRFYAGDVFQRAIICDLLYDLNTYLGKSLTPYIEYETSYLSNYATVDGIWKFYHDLEYQPCDADTTAQVIQVLLKTNLNTSILTKTEKAIDSFLDYSIDRKGAIGTWFLPPSSHLSNSTQSKQRLFYEEYIGVDIDSSKDIEVMSNFLFALYKFNHKKYEATINNGIQYIESIQNNNGNWSSTWYWGVYYGIYVCLRLLTVLKPLSPSIAQTANFIIGSQNSDGGWGWDMHKSDPLNTAFVLIGLSFIENKNKNDYSSSIKEAISYLQWAIKDSDQMKNSNFINFRKRNHSAFKSDSITLCYVAKAILVWNNYNYL